MSQFGCDNGPAMQPRPQPISRSALPAPHQFDRADFRDIQRELLQAVGTVVEPQHVRDALADLSDKIAGQAQRFAVEPLQGLCPGTQRGAALLADAAPRQETCGFGAYRAVDLPEYLRTFSVRGMVPERKSRVRETGGGPP